MKHIFYCLLLISPLTAYAAAPAPGCAKDSDACAAAPASRSPFLEASANPAKAAAAVQPAKTVKKPAPRPAAADIPAVSTAAQAAAAPVPAAPPASSNPLWVLFAAGGLAALYFYLGKDAGKKKRR